MVLESVPLDSETMRTVYPIRAHGFGLFYAAAIPIVTVNAYLMQFGINTVWTTECRVYFFT
jgi:hypothetical protein